MEVLQEISARNFPALDHSLDRSRTLNIVPLQVGTADILQSLGPCNSLGEEVQGLAELAVLGVVPLPNHVDCHVAAQDSQFRLASFLLEWFE